MILIKRAQGGGARPVITAYPGAGLVDIAEKDIPVVIEKRTALDVYACAGKDDVPKPTNFVAADVGNDVEALLLFPAAHIILGNVGNHVNMAAGAALAAAYGRFFFQRIALM